MSLDEKEPAVADIVVGVPCYRDGPMVERCLRSLQEAEVQLLLVDNGADADVKQVLADRGIIIRNDVNRYVNPAWNQIMKWFLEAAKYKILVVANSDLVMEAGWAAKLRAHVENNPKASLFFGRVGENQSSKGAFFAMCREAVLASYPIPEDILIYGGDDFIFEVHRQAGLLDSVMDDVVMWHAVSGTISKAPELAEIGRRDNACWHHYVLPQIVPQRVKEIAARNKR